MGGTILGRADLRGKTRHSARALLPMCALAMVARARAEALDGIALSPTFSTGQPRGIYVLDSSQGATSNGVSMRDANIRDLPFVTGYVLRASWEVMEPGKEAYDFTIIDNIITKLEPLGQRLSLIITPQDPSYIGATPGVVAWQDLDRDGTTVTRAVPWDPFLQEQREKFLNALATHRINATALRDHPILAIVNPFLPGGHTGIRDPNIVKLKNLPGYTRSGLLGAEQHELRLLTDNFPSKYVQIGFWKVTDNNHSPEAWEEIRLALLSEFDGVTRPRVGFWMENLAASRPGPGQDPVSGYPTTTFGAPLYLSQSSTWADFQALTSWLHPFTGPEKVANAAPADGMQYAYATYGSKYFEIYLPDIDEPSYCAGLEYWHDRLFPPTVAVTSPTSGSTVKGGIPLWRMRWTTSASPARSFNSTARRSDRK